jgi:dihydroorotase-like cyclic amidohydrolase
LQVCTVENEGLECTQQTSKLLIQGGTVVNADYQQQADVYIEDGVIKLVAPNLKVSKLHILVSKQQMIFVLITLHRLCFAAT